MTSEVLLDQIASNFANLSRLVHVNTVNCQKSSDYILPTAVLYETQGLQLALKEVLEGPLKGHSITLVMEQEVEAFVPPDSLLKNIKVPLKLLTIQRNQSNLELQILDLKQDVLVLLTYTGTNILPLQSLSTVWTPSATIVVKVSRPCEISDLFESPLLAQCSQMLLMCQDSRGNVPLSTWKPFIGEMQQLGIWDAQRFSSSDDLFPDRFSTFAGSTLHVSSDQNDMPLLVRNEDGVGGVSNNIMDALGSWLNFTYTLTVVSSDEEWGSLENGSWNGMLGDIYRGEKDLAINYFTITAERAQDFDFSVPYYNEGFGFVGLIPAPLPPWMSLLFPFSPMLWMSLAVIIAVACVCLHILQLQGDGHGSISQSIITVSQSLFNQGLNKLPTILHLRIFFIFWWLCALVLVVSYTSNLIAVLTIPAATKKIHTPEELAKADLRLCMLDYGEFVPEALKSSSDITFRTLGNKMDMVPFLLDLDFVGEEGCVELVVAGTHAHIETYSYLQLLYINLGFGDRVYTYKSQIYEGNLAFFFRKNTPWKYKLDIGIQRLVEGGLVQKWYTDIMDSYRKGIVKKDENNVQALKIDHVQGLFMLVAVIYLICLLVFFFENLISRYRKSAEKKSMKEMQ
ncbi:unnamed protein product, partial [Meganyctiphanes norvegica]